MNKKAKKAFGSHTIQQTSGWHWHCLGTLVGMKANSVQMWPLLRRLFEACWFSEQKAREEGDWQGISMEGSERSYFKPILHHTGLAIVLSGRGSQKHECCCDPLYALNFSATSVGPELARLLHAVEHCMEILRADGLMKHVVIWVWSWELYTWMNVAKRTHVDGLCRDSLGVSVPRSFQGGRQGLAYMDLAACVFLHLGLHPWEVNGVKPPGWVSLCLLWRHAHGAVTKKSCPFFLNLHGGSLWGMICEPCPVKGLTSSQQLGVVKGVPPETNPTLCKIAD